MSDDWSAVLTLDQLAEHVASWSVHANGEPEIIAAFALHGCLGDISENIYCGWIDAVCLDAWGWILSPPGPVRAVSLDSLTADIRRCRLLAEVSGWWWASYDLAVPLAEWEAKHGAIDRWSRRGRS